LKCALRCGSSAKSTFKFYKRGYKIQKIFLLLIVVGLEHLKMVKASSTNLISKMGMQDYHFCFFVNVASTLLHGKNNLNKSERGNNLGIDNLI